MDESAAKANKESPKAQHAIQHRRQLNAIENLEDNSLNIQLQDETN
jgi:hypothetical protein